MRTSHQLFRAMFTMVLVVGATTSAGAQTRAKASGPIPAIVRANELYEKAVELHAQPSRAYEAAQLHLQSVQLRTPNDPKAVDGLALAAHMYNYSGRPLDAKRTMERAAERALAMGDVVRAAQAYVDATFIANEQKNTDDVGRLGRKALLLAESPLLSSEQRTGITSRITKNPGIAQIVR